MYIITGGLCVLCVIVTASFSDGITKLTLSPTRREHVRYSGSSLYVSCRSPLATGSSPVWLSPSKNNITDRQGPVHVEWSMDGDIAVIDLVLDPISSRHSGTYTCITSHTDAGPPHSASFKLIVLKPISFRAGQSVQHAIEGQQYVVRCDTSGDPPPRTSWRALGRRPVLGPDKKYDLVSGLDSGHGRGLLIRRVSRSDAGLYRCRATQVTSRASDVRLFNIQLHVQYKPEWPSVLSGIVVFAYLGETASLSCRAAAQPPAQFSWHKNGAHLQFDADNASAPASHVQQDNNQTGTSVLHFTSLKPESFGEYTCRAENHIGRIERSIWLKRVEKPAAPSVNISQVAANFVRLTAGIAASVGEPAINGILVQYRSDTTSWQQSTSVRVPADESVMVGRLVEDTQYELRVAFVTSAGVGRFSEPLHCRTSVAAANTAPTWTVTMTRPLVAVILIILLL